MKLNIIERLTIMQILPQQGNSKTLKLVKDFQGIIGLSQEELKKYEVVQKEAGRITWNVEKEESKEITIDKPLMDIIVKQFEKLNNEERLPMEYLEVYNKFCK